MKITKGEINQTGLSVKCKALAHLRFVKIAFLICKVAAYPSMRYRGREHLILQWRPPTLIQCVLFRHCPWPVCIHQDQVSPIPFHDVASFFDLETICRSMAHFAHDIFQADLALL